MSLGNEAYRRHDLTTAELEYRQATIDHPDAADAWNNLAQVLYERKLNPAAFEAAERAVSIGGPRQAIYELTRALIKARM